MPCTTDHKEQHISTTSGDCIQWNAYVRVRKPQWLSDAERRILPNGLLSKYPLHAILTVILHWHLQSICNNLLEHLLCIQPNVCYTAVPYHPLLFVVLRCMPRKFEYQLVAVIADVCGISPIRSTIRHSLHIDLRSSCDQFAMMNDEIDALVFHPCDFDVLGYNLPQ
jgi:hypothetical protein